MKYATQANATVAMVTTGKSRMRTPVPKIPTPRVDEKDIAKVVQTTRARIAAIGQVVAGAAAFFDDFFAALGVLVVAGIVTTIGPTPWSIAGGNRSVAASIRA